MKKALFLLAVSAGCATTPKKPEPRFHMGMCAYVYNEELGQCDVVIKSDLSPEGKYKIEFLGCQTTSIDEPFEVELPDGPWIQPRACFPVNVPKE